MNTNLLVGPRPRRDFLKDTLRATKKAMLVQNYKPGSRGFLINTQTRLKRTFVARCRLHLAQFQTSA